MRILLLAPFNSPLTSVLTQAGHDVLGVDSEITLDFLHEHEPDFLISYGYRHILKKPILDYFGKKAINLHISYLPYNRGADPNFWAHYEGAPSGVTIHHIDEGIDTGDIILRRKVEFADDDTLATSYTKLHEEMIGMFTENIDCILSEEHHMPDIQDKGTYHNSKDKDEIFSQLEKGWDTPIREIAALGSKNSSCVPT